MEMNVNGILKKSQLQSGFDEARVVVGAGGYSLLNGKRECLVKQQTVMCPALVCLYTGQG